MMTTLLFFIIVFLMLIWLIRNIFVLMLLNMIIIFVALDISNYFSVVQSSETTILIILGGIDILGWGKMIFLSIKAYRKKLQLMEEL